jgi:hypothetical protein
MRTISYFDLDATPMVNLQLYRTDEALFIYRPSKVRTALKKWLRITLIASLCTFLFCTAVIVLVKIPQNGLKSEDFVVIPIFSAYPLFILGSLLWGMSPKWLIRIDSSQIVCTMWFFGYRSTKKAERLAKLELTRKSRTNTYWQFFKGHTGDTCLPAANYEIVWLRKVIEQFEKDVPKSEPQSSDCATKRPLSLWGRVRVGGELVQGHASPLPEGEGTFMLPPSEGEGTFVLPPSEGEEMFVPRSLARCGMFSKRKPTTANHWSVYGIRTTFGSPTTQNNRDCTSAVRTATPLCRTRTFGSKKPPDNVPNAD